MNLLEQVTVAFDVHPAVVFILSYQYHEERRNKRVLGKIFRAYMSTNKLPNIVCDYCLDCLSGRTTIPNEMKNLFI